MGVFAVQHGATPLCTWHLESDLVTFHKQAVQRDNMLVLSEEARVGFVLDPAREGMEYRITIGDVPLIDITPTPDDSSGMLVSGRVFWRDLAYFDSARGATLLVLETRQEGAEHGRWVTLHSSIICVLPSKLGEERYEAMSADLDRVSRSLLADLYGKSRRSVDIRYAKEAQAHPSRETELRAIESSLAQIERLLRLIARRPASRVVTNLQRQQYWGAQRLDPAAIDSLARLGTDPRSARRPIQMLTRVKAESFDVVEHRVVKAFLELVVRRCKYCVLAANAHLRAITSEKHLRDIRLGAGPTIYESVDLPRIAKLQHAVSLAKRCEAMALAMQRIPFLRDVPPSFSILRGGVFQRNADYRTLLFIIRRFLMQHALSYEGEEYSSIIKLTWRIFEQWTFLRVVDAFRCAGVDLREWADVLRQNLRSRFIIDFDRGLMFEGALGPELRLRFRYEPWILGHNTAVAADETLHRGRSGEVAWCPDIVIECLRWNGNAWVAVYAIVLDCKYSQRVTNQHWNDIAKYQEIRSTATGKQVVKQLWLVSPSSTARIESEDPWVEFGLRGPSCDSGESVRFRLGVMPGAVWGDVEPLPGDDGFSSFAEGTLAFLRRNFGIGVAETGSEA